MRDKSFKEQRKAYRKAQRKEFMRNRKRSGSVLAGLLLLCIGAILFLREFGVNFPAWFFTWPMILIAFGLLAGAGNAFRDPGWVIITSVGTVFLLDKIWPNIPIHHFIWPVVIIALGFIIILAPRRNRWWNARHEERWKRYHEMHDNQDWEKWPPNTPNTPETPTSENLTAPPATVVSPERESDRRTSDNWLETVTIFGSVKKKVYSKNFKGGDIVSIFGGAEINLSQADFNGNIIIEVVQIFGGTKLIIPPHWQIRSEMVAVFGGIEDKRAPQNSYDEDKVVILNGTTFFGGIEIKSY
jgi:hypothetical protein